MQSSTETTRDTYLAARWLSVVGALAPIRRKLGWPAGSVALLTWAGLRGGISIALALSLPPDPLRTTLLAAAYVLVCFSILVQGLSVGAVSKRVLAVAKAPAAAGGADTPDAARVAGP